MRPEALGAAKVLIADADANVRLALARAFTGNGHPVRATGPADTLLKWIGDPDVGLVVLDTQRAEDQAFQVLRQVRQARPALPVILTGGETSLVAAVRAVEAGAFDHVAKPYGVEELMAVAARALTPSRRPAASRPRTARAERSDDLPMIGRSAAMQELYRTIARLVSSDLAVLIVGESGTGKALIARALHDMGPRRDHAFVPLSLAAIDPGEVTRELFGGPDRPGKLALADGGVLFLDAIGDLPHEAQTRLLRIIEGLDTVINPATGRPANPRIVAAANQDLRGLVREGKFREDLYFRLNVAPLRVPTLRERTEDIAELANAFLLRAQSEGRPAKSLDPWAEQRLKAHDWPGNVRELENLLRRICAFYPDDVITISIVERELADPWPTPGARSEALALAVGQTVGAYFADASAARPVALYEHIIKAVELPLLQAALAVTGGNKLRAAEILGINRNTLRRKMEDAGLEPRRDNTSAVHPTEPLTSDGRRIAA